VSTNKKVAYLGPSGTFTEQALRSEPDLAQMDLVEFPKFTDVLKATNAGECDLGFVAIENALEGTVNITLDALAFDHDLYIQREVELAINLNLMALPGTSLEDIEVVLSHPVANAQCRNFLDTTLPNASVRPANSTSEGARRASEKPSRAALAPALAAEVHGLNILATNVADHSENKTRFVLVGKKNIPAATGHDKTSIVVTQSQDRPGSLIAILQEFAAREINLTYLTSRPVKTEAMGNYCFVIDFDGHISDSVVKDCLIQIKAKHAEVKFLGSYPNCNVTERTKTETDQALQDAQEWLEQLAYQQYI